MDIKDKDKSYIAKTYNRFDVLFEEGHGSYLYDENGKEYLDFSCGIGVTGLGHSNEKWKSAVTAQICKLEHISNLYYTSPCAELAEKLCARTGMKRAFFCNSGTEANECAIKAARKYAADKGKKNSEIISLANSFHGRTLASLTLTGQDALHKDAFAPYPGGFKYVPANDFDAFTGAVNENTAAVVVELVQGEGGVIPLDKDYVKKVCGYCAEKDILFIADEVQTGNGRTGELYAYMLYGVQPDIFTTAKGLANGLPIGAALFNEKTENVFAPGDHGSTFGGNPVACAAALATLNQLDAALFQNVREKGEKLRAALISIPSVKSVAGLGLMLGIETENAKQKQLECLKRGLVVLTAHDKLRLLPPLNMSDEELEKGIKILKEALK